MERQIATTREQSDRLLKCGVSAYTADMTLSYCKGGFYQLMATPFHYGCFDDKDTPAFSLGCLLGLLPKELDDFPFAKWYEPFQDGWEISEKDSWITLNGEVRLYFSNGSWIVDYDWDGFQGKLPQSDNPIEACVLAIELLTANGYKLNGIEKGGPKQ